MLEFSPLAGIRRWFHHLHMLIQYFDSDTRSMYVRLAGERQSKFRTAKPIGLFCLQWELPDNAKTVSADQIREIHDKHKFGY